jgi:hypothetical protein
MRYVIGTLDAMQKIRAAVDKLAGYPFPIEELPIPPRAETYAPGAVGWMEHLLRDPEDIGNGDGLLYATDEIMPYLGQSADVDGETITVPSNDQLMTQDALPQPYQDWLAEREAPPTGMP